MWVSKPQDRRAGEPALPLAAYYIGELAMAVLESSNSVENEGELAG